MQNLTVFATIFTLAMQAWASLQHDFALADSQKQLILSDEDQPCTKTRVVTRTHYEINVVSTVYRTRMHVTHAQATPDIRLDEAKQTLVFGLEGTGCDLKACTICRMLNNCLDDQSDCTGCDLAYYCNQCTARDRLGVEVINGARAEKTCSNGPGSSMPCDKVEEGLTERHEASHFRS